MNLRRRVQKIFGPDSLELGQVSQISGSGPVYVNMTSADRAVLRRETIEGQLNWLQSVVAELRGERNADVAFAVVLVTPDDVGGSVGSAPDKLRPRARQNVIFELGYFTARLGRHKVCALYKPGVEVPSDYQGVLYLEVSGNWETALAREFRNAGLTVNLEGLLGP
jgi:predicted nucleotide-binding protein